MILPYIHLYLFVFVYLQGTNVMLRTLSNLKHAQPKKQTRPESTVARTSSRQSERLSGSLKPCCRCEMAWTETTNGRGNDHFYCTACLAVVKGGEDDIVEIAFESTMMPASSSTADGDVIESCAEEIQGEPQKEPEAGLRKTRGTKSTNVVQESTEHGNISTETLPNGEIVTNITSKLLVVNQGFETFIEFKQRLETYSKQNYVQFVLADTKKIKQINKRMSTNEKRYCNKFVYKYVKFRCKHGSQHIRPRSDCSYTRPNQRFVSRGLFYLYSS